MPPKRYGVNISKINRIFLSLWSRTRFTLNLCITLNNVCNAERFPAINTASFQGSVSVFGFYHSSIAAKFERIFPG